ncbi:probetacellulin-like isoform X1 [Mobula birostris]|uniref:probetacellulin-like isoform X1 n=1 Tax=Mobula birostris TaxID=1983395 RepID=UPI003B28A91F
MSGWQWGRAFSFVLATGFAWCNQSAADMNSTSAMHGEKYLCGQRQQVNCTDSLTETSQSGHFSKCPEWLQDYCIQGQCRFLVSEQQPSCICYSGYIGSRCEMVDMLYLMGERDQFIIMGLVLAMVVLIILIIIICICVHCYRRKYNGRRKLGMCRGATNTQPVEERNVQGENEDTVMTTLA